MDFLKKGGKGKVLKKPKIDQQGERDVSSLMEKVKTKYDTSYFYDKFFVFSFIQSPNNNIVNFSLLHQLLILSMM